MIASSGELYAPLDVRATVWQSPADNAREGGDWCSIISIVGDVMTLTIGDVSGHGQSAARAANIMLACIRGALWGGAQPSSALRSANELACAMNGGTIVTAVIAMADRRARTLTFANAGHPPPLIMSAGTHVFLDAVRSGLPLGIFRDSITDDQVVDLTPDALLIFYTDGVTEHRGDPIAGEASLLRAARRAYASPDTNDARAVACDVLKRGRGSDDAAAIALRIL